MVDRPRSIQSIGLGTVRFLSGIRTDIFKEVILNWPKVPEGDDEFDECFDVGVDGVRTANNMNYIKWIVIKYLLPTPLLAKRYIDVWVAWKRAKKDLSTNKKFMDKLHSDLIFVFQKSTWKLGQTATLATQARNDRLSNNETMLVDGAIGWMESSKGRPLFETKES